MDNQNEQIIQNERAMKHHKRFVMAVGGSVLCAVLWIASWKFMNGSGDTLIWIASIVTMMMIAVDINLSKREE
ncbi:MAG: hypothetical protein Q4D51_05000 [Eubacteriales bacterium]|nr:hypothetical protein [Eubacteriales bacterium]